MIYTASHPILWNVVKLVKYCVKKTGAFKCSKTCAHIIAVARKINQLDKYIAWMNKQKGLPMNVSRLATIDMTKGSGEKSNTCRKASQHTTKQIEQVL